VHRDGKTGGPKHTDKDVGVEAACIKERGHGRRLEIGPSPESTLLPIK
jgi:hypothetical protein